MFLVGLCFVDCHVEKSDEKDVICFFCKLGFDRFMYILSEISLLLVFINEMISLSGENLRFIFFVKGLERSLVINHAQRNFFGNRNVQ